MPEVLGFEDWDAFYHSPLQSWWLLWVAPMAFLIYRAVRGRLRPRATGKHELATRFVDVFALVFVAETLLDPVATGPLLRALGLYDAAVGTGIMFLFVYLGDFRVLLLLFGLARPDRLAPTLRLAGLVTLAVPLSTGVVYGTLSALVPSLHGQWQWVIYEVSFMALALALRGSWLPGFVSLKLGSVASDPLRAYLREICAYVAIYYALWAFSDLLILLGDLDVGWATRTIANQLYYAFFIPWAWFRYRARFAR